MRGNSVLLTWWISHSGSEEWPTELQTHLHKESRAMMLGLYPYTLSLNWIQTSPWGLPKFIFSEIYLFLKRLSKVIPAAAAKSFQSCPTLCNHTDGSPIGSSVPGILQGRLLEWVAISFSNAWKWKVKVKSLSCVRLLATPWTVAHQAPPSMRFSRQEYWSELPWFLQVIFPTQGSNPRLLHCGRFFTV